MKYMLDTDICSYAIKENKKSVMDNLIAHQSDDICISAITKAEMLHGAKKKKSEKLMVKIKDFLRIVTAVPFDTYSADVYADIKNELEKDGALIGNMDMLIASCAVSVDAVLVTNNLKHFSRISNLKIQNWCVPSA